MIASNLSVISCRRANSSLCLSAVEEHLEASSSYRNLSPTGHLLVAVTLGFIGTFGFLNNLLVLVLFCRYKILRSPINFLLVNICLSDLLVCVLGTPFSFAASTQGRWLIGDSGCEWYGFANSLLGECFAEYTYCRLCVIQLISYVFACSKVLNWNESFK